MEDEFLAIREGVQSVCDRFGDDYWLARDQDGVFPHEFHRAFAEAGWLGITMPEEYGGAGLGVSGIVDGVEGDGETIALPLVSRSSVIDLLLEVGDQSEGRPEVGGEDAL